MKTTITFAAAAVALSSVAVAQPEGQQDLTLTGTQPAINSLGFTDTTHDFNSLSARQENITTFTTEDNSGNAYTVSLEQPDTDVAGEYRLKKVGGANSGAAFSVPFQLRLKEVGDEPDCQDVDVFSQEFRSVAVSTIADCTYDVTVNFVFASAREQGTYQAVLKLVKS